MTELQKTNKYEDLRYLYEALELAGKSEIVQQSKRKVGAVIVKNGKVVGRGSRTTKILQEDPYKDITYHAEHVAILQAGKRAKGATIYCTLEPCACRSVLPGSWEPPDACCKLIYEAGISKVIFPKRDTCVGEGGAEYLMSKGIEVLICETGYEQFENLIDNTPWRKDVAELDKGKTFKRVC
jgi:diaminohydroxyphosphoribosylaminopyrimidine deaminase/5-amino-6-(5-phosphoribosylamino)uracil reductase